MCFNSAGQSSDARIRERVAVKWQAQNPNKTSSMPPTSLKPELIQKTRGHILNKMETNHTHRGSLQKLREDDGFGQENGSGVQSVVLHNQFTHVRTNAIAVPLHEAKRRDSVRHPTQRPLGRHGASEVSSAERLKREKRTNKAGTCVTVKPLPPTSVEVQNDNFETQTGRRICLYVFQFYVLIDFLIFRVVSMNRYQSSEILSKEEQTAKEAKNGTGSYKG